MRSDNKTYQKVAENCSQFSPITESREEFTNSGCDRENCGCQVSCVNCRHFDEGAYCNLDLYDQIVQKHNL